MKHKLKNKQVKKAIFFIRKNYLLSAFIVIIFLTLLVGFYKNFLSKTNYVYSKVEINYPESYYSKPDIWILDSLHKGEVQTGILGQPEAEILNVTYYPSSLADNQFDIFLNLKLQAGYEKSTGTYSFQRSPIAVGSPITLSFPTSHVIGTILYLGSTPLQDKYVEKTVYLVNPAAYRKSTPYLYDSIKIGDKYYNGNQTVFQILDKKLEKNVFAVVNNFTSQVSEGATDTTQDIVIIAKMRLIQKNNLLFFGGDQLIQVGDKINLSTDGGLNLNDFVVSAIK